MINPVSGMEKVYSSDMSFRTVDLSKRFKPSSTPDEVIFSTPLVKYYDEYKAVQNQITEKPEVLSNIIYDYVDKEKADEILSFLDGKNATTVRYQHLLEVDPSKADLFIKSVMELGCYDMYFEGLDNAVKDMNYNDFLSGLNKRSLDEFKNVLRCGELSTNYLFSQSDSLFGTYGAILRKLGGDLSYGEAYNAKRSLDLNTQYLSVISNKWLNDDEYWAEWSGHSAKKNIEAGDSFITKPIGYGNKDCINYSIFETKYYMEQIKGN